MIRYAHAIVDGQTIHYATEGNGPPLLLLHSPPFDHREWLPAIPYLSGHFRVIAPDLPGCGRSKSAAWNGSPNGIIRSIAALMTVLRMVPAAVAGSSYGGGIALGLAIRYPERVRALVVIGSMGMQQWPNTTQARLARTVRGIPGLLNLGISIAPRMHARWFVRSAFADQRHANSEVIDQIAGVLRDKTERHTLIRIMKQLDKWQAVIRQIGGIRAPAQLIWGEHDLFYGLPLAERLRHAIPGAQLVTLAGAGHALSIERPIELTEQMRRFLLNAIAR